ncbi:MAG: hypothetical protein ACO1TE_04170 [Prosthecobacter sp.]
MKFYHRPAFYLILVLLTALLGLTYWVSSQLDTASLLKAKQETGRPYVSPRP